MGLPTPPRPRRGPAPRPRPHDTSDAAPPRSGPPIFLVGAERSGTTLLGLMLSHHPEVAWAGEMDYAVDPLPAEGFPSLAAYWAYLPTQWKFVVRDLAVDPSLSFPELLDSFLEQVRGREEKPRVGATVHRRLDRLPELWPEATFVHLVRDPRDVARSVIRMGWSGDTWHASAGWVEAERTWDALRDAVPEERRVEVRYEELLERPEATLRGLCGDVGLTYDPEMLSYPEDSTYGPPDPHKSSRWREQAPEHDVRLCEGRVGDLLQARGYAPSGLPPLVPSGAELAQLRLADWWARLQGRIERFGLPLTAAETITRRLQLTPLHRPIQRRLHELEVAGLK